MNPGRLLFACILALAAGAHIPHPVQADAPPKHITVVDDKAYPPFAFLDSKDAPRGITIDIWNLWSRKTGIPVEFRLMDWDAALQTVEQGRADAVAGLFRTPDREQIFDFTTVIVKIESAIFFQEQISGIKDFDDLSGFQVGVVKGDSAEENIRTMHPHINMVAYPGADELVRAALAGKIKVFVADAPSALYYLAQNPERQKFRQASGGQIVNNQYSAVRKGNTETLRIIQSGFDQTSESEIDAILKEWAGHSIVRALPWRKLAATLGTLLLLTTAVMLWNIQLRKRVRLATGELEERNRQLALSHEAVRRSEESYRITLESIGDAVIATDRQNNITLMNPVAQDLTGWRTQEALDHPLSEIFRIIDANTRQPVEQPAEKALALGKKVGMANHTLLLARNGNEYIIADSAAPIRNDKGEITGAVMVFRDETERKLALEALRRSEERTHLFFERQIVGMAITSPEKNWVQVNDRLCDMLGYSRDELYRMTWAELTHPEDIAPDVTQFQRLLAAEIDDYSMEKRFIRKDGTLLHTNLYVSCVRKPNKEIDYVLALLEDVSAKKKAEADLLQAQKMDSVGQLAGGVAHDFNNMLGVILGYAEMAMDEPNQPQTVRDNLRQIQKAAERSADLTRQLLAFARKQTVAPRILDLNDTVSGMLKMLRRLIGEEIELAWIPGNEIWPVKMDPSQIDQILANLCVNARDAIGGVGKVVIETANTVLDDTACAIHADATPGSYVLLSVTDNGCGMDKETRGKIFEPFFTTKKTGEGTGLGLATVYGIVRQNDGFIHVYSEPGQGASFRIYIPRHTGEIPFESVDDNQATPQGHGETILIAEDEVAILDLGRAILESLGYNVLTAESADKAIRLSEIHPAKIRLLITDVIMPQMNGRDLAQKIQTNQPIIRTLFMSGYTADVIAHRGILGEGVLFLQKPFSRHSLAVRVREAIDGQ